MSVSAGALLLLLMLATMAEVPCHAGTRVELLNSCMRKMVEGVRVKVSCLDRLHVEGYDCEGGCEVGLFCDEDVEEGAELARMEKCKTMPFPSHQQEELQRRFRSVPQEHAARMGEVSKRLHLPLLWELFKARRLAQHPLYEYLLTVPKGLNFLNWPEEERAALEGTNLALSARSELSDMKLVCQELSLGEEMTWDDMMWCRSVVLERCFLQGLVKPAGAVLGREEEDLLPCFLPVMDLINHDALASCKLSGDESHVILRASKKMAKGEQLFFNYGSSKSNEELMFAYGFALEDNPADKLEHSAASRFSCVESDPDMFKRKMSLLKDHILTVIPEENRILTKTFYISMDIPTGISMDNISNIAILLSDEVASFLPPFTCDPEDLAEIEKGQPIRIYPEMLEELKEMQEVKLEKLDKLDLSKLPGSRAIFASNYVQGLIEIVAACIQRLQKLIDGALNQDEKRDEKEGRGAERMEREGEET
ncbi:hypothetical protein GUITHDRAFT_108853 [Guillardia theta CCMP2712]|uniref:SET domain-containing protein n=1 Tax=Guillardia theta (strain CCMP2712) TaxID=905079 RepID=L1JA65_GUITC|nr:hypothetical protein GUITHDRAFT_108853 [Guillardia theta CCMP2712]EKX45212.1 hypothetical protein GUITHDRAFT_108853 [Guillardia theta CCMP2712]|eukprot:XP_005832192.1 hypothetical protein GUITHDRAFT_108853 [Guillardia theta CCMP2712]